MIEAEDAIGLYQSLSDHNIQVWLTGGWGIDALLQEQTRPHKDLDLLMLVDDVVRIQDHLSLAGLRTERDLVRELLGRGFAWDRDSNSLRSAGCSGTGGGCARTAS